MRLIILRFLSKLCEYQVLYSDRLRESLFLLAADADLLPLDVRCEDREADAVRDVRERGSAARDELRGLRATDDVFSPARDEADVERLLAGWKDAIRRAL